MCFLVPLLGLVAGGLLAAETTPALLDRLAPTPPRPEEFVTAVGGNFVAEDATIRFWGAHLPFPLPGIETAAAERSAAGTTLPPTSQDLNEAVLARLQSLGLNLVRIDADPNGPHADAVQSFLSLCRTRGVRVWMAGTSTHLGNATPEDAVILDDPASDAAWRQALPPEGMPLHGSLARIWDPRLELLGIARLRDNARTFNAGSGLRWTDDPVIAVWELADIERWLVRMETAEWQRLPPFFVRLLLDQWNTWLYETYETDAKLEAAWGPLRLARESLADGTCLLLPLRSFVSDMPQREALGIPLEDQDYPPVPTEALSDTRRADVDAFLIKLWREHKARETAQFRRWGDGARVAPLLWHVQTGTEVEPSLADATVQTTAYTTLLDGDAPSRSEATASARMLLVTGQSQERRGYRADIPWRMLTLVADHSPAAICWDSLEASLETESVRLFDPSRATPNVGTPLDASLWAAGFLFRGGFPVPSAAPTAVRGDLTIEAAGLSVLCRSAIRRGEQTRFVNGVTFEWLEPAAPDEPTDGDQPAPPQRKVPLDHTVSAALLTEDGRAYAAARTVHLVVGIALPFADASDRPALRLALHAAVLKGATFTTYDGAGRTKTKGTVEAMPFVVDPSDGTFRVDFVPNSGVTP